MGRLPGPRSGCGLEGRRPALRPFLLDLPSWAWIAGVALGFYGLHWSRHSPGRSCLASFEQIAVVIAAAVAWLTFFFFESSVLAGRLCRSCLGWALACGIWGTGAAHDPRWVGRCRLLGSHPYDFIHAPPFCSFSGQGLGKRGGALLWRRRSACCSFVPFVLFTMAKGEFGGRAHVGVLSGRGLQSTWTRSDID